MHCLRGDAELSRYSGRRSTLGHDRGKGGAEALARVLLIGLELRGRTLYTAPMCGGQLGLRHGRQASTPVGFLTERGLIDQGGLSFLVGILSRIPRGINIEVDNGVGGHQYEC